MLMNERLRQIIEYYGISTRNFSLKIGVNESTIRKVLAENTSIQSNNLAKIAVKFPEINLDWLITGRGSMLISENKETQITPLHHDNTLLESENDKLNAICSEKERTITILHECLQQLRNTQQWLDSFRSQLNTKDSTAKIFKEKVMSKLSSEEMLNLFTDIATDLPENKQKKCVRRVNRVLETQENSED